MNYLIFLNAEEEYKSNASGILNTRMIKQNDLIFTLNGVLV